MKNDAKYNPSEIEPRCQKVWEEKGIYQPDLKSAKRPFYNLMMFPYPSAEGLHVGNMYAFTGADIYGRFMRMQGYDVFEPIGLDGFGIHSENYAIKIGKHPKEQAKISEKNFYRQLHAIGNGFAWKNKVETYDPDYYRWTQWIFVQMFKHGLAYRQKSPVNFCPSCKTVLSDEQVIDGFCERCKSAVEKREMEQWYFRITKYADQLLKNLDTLDWTNKVKIGQRNWIGKSEGLIEYWQVDGMDMKLDSFTTWPHTTWGATFIVISPEHPIIKKLVAGTALEKNAEKFCSEVIAENKKDPLAATKVRKGFFTGRYAINHLTGEKMKIFIANFAVMGYGTGIVKCCPAHDQKDFEFARKYNLEIRPVIVPEGGKSLDPKTMTKAYIGEGMMENAGKFIGMSTKKAREEISELIKSSGNGREFIQYHLRDWCISRQRYWGAPIPMIFCPSCAKSDKDTSGVARRDSPDGGGINKNDMPGWYPVPEDQLPVLLPDLNDWKPEGTGKGPLAKLKDWVKVKCLQCGGVAQRETDVCDTFLDSSWYHMRYPSIGIELSNRKLEVRKRSEKLEVSYKNPNSNIQSQYPTSNIPSLTSTLSLPWSSAITRRWLPVDMYIGGAEHTVLHLLYARFVAMVFKDLGNIEFDEPYTRFYAHGLIIAEGAKMSKSRGNIVIPDAYINKYGADTLRTYLMFLGPFDHGGDFRDTGIAGMYRFLSRVWRLVLTVIPNASEGSSERSERKNASLDPSTSLRSAQDDALRRVMHHTIKEVSEDLENLHYNTAIAHIMEYVNHLTESLKDTSDGGPDSIGDSSEVKESIKTLLLLLAPFAPHMTEELWQRIQQCDKDTSGVARRDSPGGGGTRKEYSSIHLSPWPAYDPKYLVEDEVTIIVQVNGKLRDVIKAASRQMEGKDTSWRDQKAIEEIARKSAKIQKYLSGKTIRKTIFLPGKLINFVVD